MSFWNTLKSKSKKLASAAVLIMLISLIPVRAASAKDFLFSNEYISLKLPDDATVLTPATGSKSGDWEKVGVTNSKYEIERMKSQDMIAEIFYPGKTQPVSVVSSINDVTKNIFSFSGLTEAQIEEQAKKSMSVDVTGATDFDIRIVHDIGGATFFRTLMTLDNEEFPGTQLSYITVENGRMLQFALFCEKGSILDESVLEKTLEGFAFTAHITREEFDENVRSARIKLAVIVAGVIVLIAALVLLARIRKARSAKRARQITAAMSDFRERENAGKVNREAEPVYTVKTAYTGKLLDDYSFYKAWINPDISLHAVIVIFLLFAAYMLWTGNFLLALVLMVFLGSYLYINYSKTEKLKEQLGRRFDIRKHPEPTFKFYDEYFTVTGLSTAGEYLYAQVTLVSSFKNTVFIFIGDNNALMISKDDLKECTVDDLKKLIRVIK